MVPVKPFRHKQYDSDLTRRRDNLSVRCSDGWCGTAASTTKAVSSNRALVDLGCLSPSL